MEYYELSNTFYSDFVFNLISFFKFLNITIKAKKYEQKISPKASSLINKHQHHLIIPLI